VGEHFPASRLDGSEFGRVYIAIVTALGNGRGGWEMVQPKVGILNMLAVFSFFNY
jgi:hypothetical protein